MAHKIEWLNRPGTAGATWNPVTGCTKISSGCKNCYAERMSKRLKGRFGYPADDPFAVTLHPDKLDQPLHWKKPRTVFVCSMGDLFHEDLAVGHIEPIFQVMQATPQHTYIVLTKRPKRMSVAWSSMLFHHNGGYPHVPLSNVIGMVTAENQEQADRRIPWLLRTPFAVRGVSVEPMLGPIDLTIRYNAGVGVWHNMNALRGYGGWGDFDRDKYRLHWVIAGAETGPGARPMDLAWARNLRDQCKVAGVPYFFKRTSPGTETPPDLEVREWPSS